MNFYLFVKNRRYVFFLALSIALVFIYFPLMGDTKANFFYIQNGNIKNVYNWIPYELKQKFNLDFFYVIYFYTFIIFYCWFKSIAFLGKGSDQNIWLIFCFVSIFFIIYRDVMDLHRTYLAFSLSLFYFYYIRQRFELNLTFKICLFVLFLGLTLSIHPYALMFFILFMIAQLPFDKINNKWIYMAIPLVLILGIYSQSILSFILQFLPSSGLKEQVNFYISNQSQWGYTQQAIVSIFFKKLREILFLIFVIILSLQNKKEKKQAIISNILILMSLLTLFLLMYRTLFERSFILISLFSIVLFSYPNLSKKQFYLKFVLIILIVSRFFIVNFHDRGEFFLAKDNSIIFNSDQKIELELKPLYYPTLKLLNITEEGYSDEFIKQNPF